VNDLPVLDTVRGRSDHICAISWHPNAKCIAVPEKSSVHVYDRNANFLFAFDQDGHSKAVCIASWSPNGEYLASVR
jgi:WD40 repeat protein